MKLTARIKTPKKLTARFKELKMPLSGGFEEGYNQGYATGYEIGNAEGYTKGHIEGVAQGYNDGYAKGEESRYSIEDKLLAKTIESYANSRPVSIGNRFFSYCYNLVTVELPNAVSIGDYAFTYCTALKEIVLPSVTSIAPFAFQNCTALTTVELGVVNALQSNVFTNTNIKQLILRRTDTITTNNSTAVFNNTPIARGEGYIYVPAALVEQYKSATNWKTYASQIRAIEDYPEITGM